MRYSDTQLERAQEYIKFPSRYFPSYLEALAFMHCCHHIDSDILRSIDYHYCVKSNGMPEFHVRCMLNDDLIDQITIVQHSKLF